MKKIFRRILIVGIVIACVSIHYNPERYIKTSSNQNAIEVITDDTEATISPKETAIGIQTALDVLNGPAKNFCEGALLNATQFISDTWMSVLDGTGHTSDNENLADKASGGIKDFFAQISSSKKATSECDTATLERVIDGDTIVVNIDDSSQKIRFIGIDTPESVNPDESKNNIYGQMASDYTKELLKEVTTVYLTYDEEKTDQYGRTLAYVWFSDPDSVSEKEVENQMLNAVLVKNGYAYNKVYMPNKKYADLFDGLRKNAQDSNMGLWQYPDFSALWER